MTDIRRLYVLLCGYEILPKTVSTRGLGGRFVLSEPICAYLLDTASGWVLLDAGLDPRHVADPARRQSLFLDHGLTPPVHRSDHDLGRQLAAIGIGFSDIGHVILSHLHYDHCGYLRQLAHARIFLQRRELAAAFAGGPMEGYIRSDFDDPRLRFDLKDGDWEAMPGLRLLDTRGHTEGHQSALVELPRSGRFVLPFDAGDLQENFDREILPGFCCDDSAALAAIRRLNDLVAGGAGRLLLFHDPVAIQTLRLAPDFYD